MIFYIQIMQQSYLYFFIFLFFLIDNQSFAQTDTLQLPEVELKVRRTNRVSGYGKYTVFDSIIRLENRYAHIGKLLSEDADVLGQNYGLGQLASVRVRGMAASHTQVYWQDVPLNSNMLGQTDFSLMPTALFSDIVLSYGASGSDKSSNSLGANVMLNSDVDLSAEKTFGIEAGQQISDALSSTTFLRLHYADKKKSGQTKLLSTNSANTFRYVNHFEAGKPVQRAENAGFHQHHLMQSFAFRSNKIGTIRSHLWLTDSHRNLVFSKATQRDRALRAVSSLEGKYYQVTLAYINEFLNYNDKNINLNADSYSQRAFLKGQVRHSTRLLNNKSGFALIYDKAQATGYPLGEQQWLLSLFSDNQLTFKYLYLNVLLREEWRDGKFSPLLYTINIRPRHLSSFKLELTHSRNINYPTFNDQHWQPGGNPDLQPEKARHWELNMSRSVLPEYKHERNYFSIKTNLALYHIRLNNRIQWLPTNAGYWAAFNVKNVHHTGIEAAFPMEYVMNDWQVSWTNGYAWMKVIDKTPDSETYGNQLPYVSRHSWNTVLRMGKAKQGWSLVYRHGTTTRRFTLSDNSMALPMYDIGSVSVNYDLIIKNKFNMRFDLNINNLWNEDYEITQGYRMPLRYVELGFSVSVN